MKKLETSLSIKREDVEDSSLDLWLAEEIDRLAPVIRQMKAEIKTLTEQKQELKGALTQKTDIKTLEGLLFQHKGVAVETARAEELPVQLLPEIFVNTQKALDAIGEFGNSKYKDLMQVLLDQVNKSEGKDIVKSVEVRDHELIIKLNKPFSIRVNTTNKEGKQNPEGGAIFMLGQEKPHELKIVKKKDRMQFDGFQMYVKAPAPFGFLTVNMKQMKDIGNNFMEIVVGAKVFGFEKNEQQTRNFDMMLKTWQKGFVLKEPFSKDRYQKILKSEFPVDEIAANG